MIIIKNAKVFDGESFQEQKNVLVDNEKIVGYLSSQESISIDGAAKSLHALVNWDNAIEIDAKNNILAPGFIDIQINGGGGVLFNEDPSVQTISKIQQAHLRFGTTSFLPTIISDSFDVMQRALCATHEAVLQKIPGVLGIHLEGPFLNSDKNGIHSKKYIRKPNEQDIDEICNSPLSLKLVTLAPEEIKESYIKKLIENNIFLFAGHTNASFESFQEVYKLGLKGITHFFNACSPFQSRFPGVVGAGLYFDDVYCGLIADGFHVNYNAIKIAFKVKRKDYFILVSDAMPCVGTDIPSFTLQGQKILVEKGRCVDDLGTLAGASLTIHQSIKNLIHHECCSIEEALAMSSTNAARCLKVDGRKGFIRSGFDADLVLLDKDSLDLIHVIQGGVFIQ